MSMDVLQEGIRRLKNPTVLSLKPTDEVVPGYLLEAYSTKTQAWGAYCETLLEALKEWIPAVKVSFPCFAALGGEGVSLMQRIIRLARELGYYVILDGLGGDWGAAAKAAADSVFQPDGPYFCDCAVLNGYWGSDGIKPFLPYCKEDKSVFVSVKSPNRSSVEIQDLMAGGRLVHTAMADLVNRWGGEQYGKYGYSPVGALVGATHPEILKTLRAKYDRVFFLVTGLDIPGANPKGCQSAFDRFGHGAAVCAARSILSAWNTEGSDGKDFAQKAVEAAQKLRKNLGKYVQIM